MTPIQSWAEAETAPTRKDNPINRTLTLFIFYPNATIAANKCKGIRAALCNDVYGAKMSREHNNANIMTLSYKENTDDLKEMITIFLNTPFSNEERHARRVNKISEMEQ